MKIAGIMLITIFCIMTAVRRANTYRAHVDELEAVSHMINIFMTQIRCKNEPIIEIIEDLCSKDDLNKLEFLNICNQKIKSGIALPIAWRQSINEWKCRLTDKEKSILLSFGNNLGISDEQSQIENCEYHDLQIVQALDLAKEEKDKKYKLYSYKK